MSQRTPPSKNARGGGSGWSKVTPELYDAMWRAFQEKQSYQHVARTCGVSEATAWRYVEKGDPRRGWDPIGDRFAKVQRTVARKAEDALTRDMTSMLSSNRRCLGRLVEWMQVCDPNEVDEKGKRRWKPPASIAADLRAVCQTILLLHGQADQRVEVQGTMTMEDARKAVLDAAQLMGEVEAAQTAAKSEE